MMSSRFSVRNSSGLSTLNPESGARLGFSTGIISLVILISLIDLVLYHWPLFSYALDNLDGFSSSTILVLTTLSVVVFVVTALIFSLLLLITQKLLKPLAVLMFLGNAIALYFVETYQVVLDKTMAGNVLNTDFDEATSFLHPKLFLYLFVFGLLPCWFLLRKRVRNTSRWRLALFTFCTLFAGLAWIYTASSTWLWIDNNAKKLGGMILPWSYVINTARYQALQWASSREQIPLPPATFTSDGKRVVVLVIGESARARNFSLYGYDRPTNPLLAKEGAVAMRHTLSCSTYTTASIRCMLSHRDPGSAFSEQYEPLPSYLQRYGVDVVWRSKNWGEPPMELENYVKDKELKKTCREAEGCDHDEILLSGLAKRIRSSKSQRVFVVLHQKGSHGPNYFDRYSSRFEVFKPVCKSVELNQCTQQQLLNTYDNTILYTDYFLDRAIEMLKGMEGIPTMLMYMSDHGESLGEHGLYLHGTPFAIAPEVQKEIPFIVWMSSEFMQKEGVSVSQLKRQSEHSQRNIFHSVLGAFDMQSEVYDAKQDIFSGNN
jgi:lipid A ethanolaminephosphotransferase